MDTKHHEDHEHITEKHLSDLDKHEDHSNHVSHHEKVTPSDSPAAIEHGQHPEHDAHQAEESHDEHQEKGDHVDHRGHEEMFRQRFWVCLVLSIPVLLFSPAVQGFRLHRHRLRPDR